MISCDTHHTIHRSHTHPTRYAAIHKAVVICVINVDTGMICCDVLPRRPVVHASALNLRVRTLLDLHISSILRWICRPRTAAGRGTRESPGPTGHGAWGRRCSTAQEGGGSGSSRQAHSSSSAVSSKAAVLLVATTIALAFCVVFACVRCPKEDGRVRCRRREATQASCVWLSASDC